VEIAHIKDGGRGAKQRAQRGAVPRGVCQLRAHIQLPPRVLPPGKTIPRLRGGGAREQEQKGQNKGAHLADAVTPAGSWQQPARLSALNRE
jgi:hypothetical protein